MALAVLGLVWTGLAKEKVFVLVAHPDDTLACAGTMFLMKDAKPSKYTPEGGMKAKGR